MAIRRAHRLAAVSLSFALAFAWGRVTASNPAPQQERFDFRFTYVLLTPGGSAAASASLPELHRFGWVEEAGVKDFVTAQVAAGGAVKLPVSPEVTVANGAPAVVPQALWTLDPLRRSTFRHDLARRRLSGSLRATVDRGHARVDAQLICGSRAVSLDFTMPTQQTVAIRIPDRDGETVGILLVRLFEHYDSPEPWRVVVGPVFSAAFSRDGRFLAFQRGRVGGIHRVRGGGERTRRLQGSVVDLTGPGPGPLSILGLDWDRRPVLWSAVNGRIRERGPRDAPKVEGLFYQPPTRGYWILTQDGRVYFTRGLGDWPRHRLKALAGVCNLAVDQGSPQVGFIAADGLHLLRGFGLGERWRVPSVPEGALTFINRGRALLFTSLGTVRGFRSVDGVELPRDRLPNFPDGNPFNAIAVSADGTVVVEGTEVYRLLAQGWVRQELAGGPTADDFAAISCDGHTSVAWPEGDVWLQCYDLRNRRKIGGRFPKSLSDGPKGRGGGGAGTSRATSGHSRALSNE